MFHLYFIPSWYICNFQTYVSCYIRSSLLCSLTTGTRPYICSYCDKKFPTSTNLRRHEKVHQGHKFSCPHCSTTFTQTGDLKKHVRKAHPELFSECGFCTRYFVKKRLLVDHLLEMHDGKTVEENDKEIEAKQEAFRYDLNMDKVRIYNKRHSDTISIWIRFIYQEAFRYDLNMDTVNNM